MKKVMVLEDESSIRSFIVINLRRAGYDVIEAETGEEALDKLKENPDTRVALLDIMLPGIDGFEVCRRIRATNTKIGIIMLTARSQEMDKVTGLMTGADDYVTKPFSPAELTARVDALFRRAGGEEIPQTGEIRQDPFLLNTRNRTLEKNGQRIKLTQVEYSIMKVFMENPGKALSREEILDMVWGRDYGPGIPEAELPFIKQKFYKGSSKARGSGIGLAVCDEIVGLHNGIFTIGNADGGGAVVTICLPVKE